MRCHFVETDTKWTLSLYQAGSVQSMIITRSSPLRRDDLMAPYTDRSHVSRIEFRAAVGYRFNVVRFKEATALRPMSKPTPLTSPVVPLEDFEPEACPMSAIPK